MLTLRGFVKSEMTNIEPHFFVSIVFSTEILSGKISFSPEEILDVGWFSYEEILAMKNELRDVDLVLGAIENVRNGLVVPLSIVKNIETRKR